MSKIVIAAILATSMLTTAMSVHANTYVDPRAPFDAARFLNSLPSGQ